MNGWRQAGQTIVPASLFFRFSMADIRVALCPPSSVIRPVRTVISLSMRSSSASHLSDFTLKFSKKTRYSSSRELRIRVTSCSFFSASSRAVSQTESSPFSFSILSFFSVIIPFQSDNEPHCRGESRVVTSFRHSPMEDSPFSSSCICLSACSIS